MSAFTAYDAVKLFIVLPDTEILPVTNTEPEISNDALGAVLLIPTLPLYINLTLSVPPGENAIALPVPAA